MCPSQHGLRVADKLCLQLGAQGMDTAKAYVAEREALEALRHEWALPQVETRAVVRLRKLVAAAPLGQ